MSLVNLRVYEGVPVGGNNFEDILNYIRGFLGANFGFSTNTLGNQGGYFQGDNFVYKSKPSASSGSAWFFVPNTKPLGNLFGQYGNEYYKFDVPTFDASSNPGVNVWTVLATDTRSNSLSSLLYENTEDKDSRQLPYRPIRFNEVGQFSQRYQSVRFNGIPQTDLVDYTVSFSTGDGGFQRQSLQVNRLTLGAEHPKPVLDRRYDDFTNLTRNTLTGKYDSKLTFEFTNFSIESGGHLVMWRENAGNNYFSYIPQDLGSSGEVPIGTYRVVDYSRGIVEVRPSIAQVEQLRLNGENTPTDDIPFTVVSPEQLRTDVTSGVTNYMSRYGEVYNGSTLDMLLIEYIFDGNNHIVREIPSTEYYGASGSVLLQDVNQNYADGVVLAVRYVGVPNQNELLEAQRNRYHLDTFQLYFHSGIVTTSPTGDIRAAVEMNPTSWYNRDVYDAEYFPVNRADEAFYTLILESEEEHFDIAFNPNLAFEIVDTISLLDLADIGGVSADQVLVYDGSVFNGVDYTLEQLRDTAVSSAQNNHVLQRSGSQWVNRTVTQMLRSTNITELIQYSTSGGPNYNPPAIAGGPTNNGVLVHKKYVDDLVASVGGDNSSALVAHINNTTNAHGATPNPIPNAIARRDASGGIFASTSGSVSLRRTAGTEGQQDEVLSNLLINPAWLTNLDNATFQQHPGTLIRRDNSGRARVVPPGSSSPNDTIATKGYVDNEVAEAKDTVVTFEEVWSSPLNMGDYAAHQHIKTLVETYTTMQVGFRDILSVTPMLRRDGGGAVPQAVYSRLSIESFITTSVTSGVRYFNVNVVVRAGHTGIGIGLDDIEVGFRLLRKG